MIGRRRGLIEYAVVGHTDEVGVTLPPLHPRCRCAIAYREVGNSLQRPAANRGAFAHLEVPMHLKSVKQICRKYGVDISSLRIKIEHDEELLRIPYAGLAAPERVGQINLFPGAFCTEDELLRTIIHEGCHVKQFKRYGSIYVQENKFFMELVAERYEEFFFEIARRRSRR